MAKEIWKDYILSIILSIAVFAVVYMILSSNANLYNQEIFNCDEKTNNQLRLLFISPSIMAGITTLVLLLPKSPNYRKAVNCVIIICLLIGIWLWSPMLGLLNNTHIMPMCMSLNG